jgi:solute:Na+ symporter, SSS family
MMISAVVVVGIGIPYYYYGGIGKMFHVLISEEPHHLIFPGSTTNYSTLWVMSTVLLTSLGFYMWPHNFGSVFSARNASTIKRNAIIMPFYQIPLLLILCVGFTALLVIPGLKNSDMALLEIVKKTFPDWFLGFVGAAGAVTAMVPAAILILSASTLFSKNIYKDGFNPKASETSVINLSRIMAIVITALALFLSITIPSTLVRLLLIGFNGVAQFFPGVVLGLFWKRITANATIAGMIAGICTVIILMITKQDPFHGLNGGFVALSINFMITVVLSIISGKKPSDNPFAESVTNSI